jgi:hypothetical protein
MRLTASEGLPALNELFNGRLYNSIDQLDRSTPGRRHDIRKYSKLHTFDRREDLAFTLL